MAGGERLRYEPFAIVYHSIPADRLNKRYFEQLVVRLRACTDAQKGPRTKVWGVGGSSFSLPNIALQCFFLKLCGRCLLVIPISG